MTVADLQRRGWTDHLIRFFVPPPVKDQAATGDATEPLWTPEAIAAVEARPEFQATLLRALWERPRTDVPALRCPLSVERLTAGLAERLPAQVLVDDMTRMSEASLLDVGNRHDVSEALAEYNRRRRDRGRLTLDTFHTLCRPSMPTPDIITEEHRRAIDRALRTLWQVEEDTGAKVELELREGGSRQRLMPDEPYEPPCADFDVLAALEAARERGRRMTWGAWKNWDPTMATEPPADIFPPGTVVQADTMIRPEWIGRIDRPHLLKADEFVVMNGESWVLDWDYPETTHVVVRYRVRSKGLTGMTEEEALERVRRVAHRYLGEKT